MHETIRTLAHASLQNLEANRQRIDDLNVYPVPDGDTGSNLVLTLRRVVETIDESQADLADSMLESIQDDPDVASLYSRTGDEREEVIEVDPDVADELERLGLAEEATTPSAPEHGFPRNSNPELKDILTPKIDDSPNSSGKEGSEEVVQEA